MQPVKLISRLSVKPTVIIAGKFANAPLDELDLVFQ